MGEGTLREIGGFVSIQGYMLLKWLEGRPPVVTLFLISPSTRDPPAPDQAEME
jgi:hypothetical protein